ncbi:UNVERIFIED_CONTAM: hypothetical protein Slati_1946000 [Sesamum latifolium]|uniref:Uncharacterized protein n=1 Tax=Sesamum latifolium TaxID=2727402 RepID=A0AAW2X7S6_9LAMI
MGSDRHSMQSWHECHVCSQSLEPEDFVNPCYSMAIFIEVYKHAILPVNGPKLWEKTVLIPPLPPNFGRGVERPAKARRLEPDELSNKGKKRTRGQRNQSTKLKKQPYKVMCHYCGETCHNKKGCARKKMDHPVEPSAAEQPRKMTARKKTSTTMQPTVIAEKPPGKTTRKSMQQGQMEQFTANPDSRRTTRSKFIESSSQPNFASSQSNTSEMASLHNAQQ